MIADKVLWLQGSLVLISGVGTPVLTVLNAKPDITGRDIAAMIIGGIVGGAVALTAWLSTAFALSPGQIVKREQASKSQ